MKTSPTKNNYRLANSILISVVLSLVACSDVGQSEGMKVTDYPDHQSEAAQLYIAKCGECHAAPLPGTHTADHWPGVVQRMVMRMNNKAIQPPNGQELAVILGYLQKHAQQQ